MNFSPKTTNTWGFCSPWKGCCFIFRQKQLFPNFKTLGEIGMIIFKGVYQQSGSLDGLSNVLISKSTPIWLQIWESGINKYHLVETQSCSDRLSLHYIHAWFFHVPNMKGACTLGKGLIYHQHFQVPKMEILNFIRLWGYFGGGFSLT